MKKLAFIIVIISAALLSCTRSSPDKNLKTEIEKDIKQGMELADVEKFLRERRIKYRVDRKAHAIVIQLSQEKKVLVEKVDLMIIKFGTDFRVIGLSTKTGYIGP